MAKYVGNFNPFMEELDKDGGLLLSEEIRPTIERLLAGNVVACVEWTTRYIRIGKKGESYDSTRNEQARNKT